MSSNENHSAAAYGNVWLDANRYYEAERRHYEISLADLASEVGKRANPGSPPKRQVPNGITQSSLASEIAYARQKIQNFLKSGDVGMEISQPSIVTKFERFEKEHDAMLTQIEKLTGDMNKVLSKLSAIEKAVFSKNLPVNETQVSVKENTKSNIQNGAAANEDDDLDLFGSDEEDATATKLREERLQAYANKKAKKPALVAKSSVVLDVKPWDDETDMKSMETEVRKIQTEGLKWGASKLVPLAYGINKLQIVAVVEDEKVSIDWLQDTISEIEELVQSVDIAAFNKL